jgi:hypothetical protein
MPVMRVSLLITPARCDSRRRDTIPREATKLCAMVEITVRGKITAGNSLTLVREQLLLKGRSK